MASTRLENFQIMVSRPCRKVNENGGESLVKRALPMSIGSICKRILSIFISKKVTSVMTDDALTQ